MGIKVQQTASVDVLMDKLTGRTKQILYGIGLFCLIVFFIYVLILSYQWLSSPNILVQFSNTMRLPMIFVYISVPTSFVFMTIHAIDLFLKNLKQQGRGDIC